MKTKPWAVCLIALGTLFTTAAQIFYKTGANRLALSNWYINWHIPAGIILYIIAGILLITALKGGDVSVLYPVFATSFIWVIIFSRYIFGEPFTFQKWAGVAVIILGITLISVGSHRQHAALEFGGAA